MFFTVITIIEIEMNTHPFWAAAIWWTDQSHSALCGRWRKHDTYLWYCNSTVTFNQSSDFVIIEGVAPMQLAIGSIDDLGGRRRCYNSAHGVLTAVCLTSERTKVHFECRERGNTREGRGYTHKIGREAGGRIYIRSIDEASVNIVIL